MLMVITVLLLLLATAGIDVGNLAASLGSAAVLGPAAGFVVFLVAFVLVERRAKARCSTWSIWATAPLW